MNVQSWIALALMFLLVPDPNPRKAAGRAGTQEQAPAKSDTARLGLRGPIKSCLEENTLPPDGRAYSTYQEFSPEGKPLLYRARNPDGSEWVTTSTYDADNRLVKSVSGKAGDPPTETLYKYDDQGRLVSVTTSASKNRTEYRYDEHGRKTEIRTFEPKPPQQGQVGFSGSAWDAAVSGFDVPDGGSVTTVYDENERPAEAQVRDAQGQIVSRVVRTYNAAGLVVKEQPILANPASVLDKLPAEMRSRLNDEQKQTMMAMMGGQVQNTTLFGYDAQGRVTTESQTGGLFQTAKMTVYNDHGDIAEQRTTMISAMAMGAQYSMGENGALIPDKPAGPEANVPLDADVHYTYQYDQYGNWTQQTMTDARHPEAPPSVRRRTLTYY